MANRNPEDSFTTPKEKISGLPDYGWRVNLDHQFTEKCKPFQSPRLSQIPSLVGLGLRYTHHTLKCYMKGRRPHMDFVNPVLHKPIYGCPIGGIGSGTIGRGYRGEFCRFHMVPGIYDYHTVQADAFILCIRKDGQTVYQKVLTGHRVSKSLKTWQWGFPQNQATYQTLYPRAWTVYNIPEHKLRLICRQISPIIPHDYKDSSFPMTAFIWEVENQGTETLDVSITFTFKNGTGGKKDHAGGCWTESFCNKDKDKEDTVSGVMIHQKLYDMACTYAIAATKKDGVEVSHCLNFDPHGSGAEVWNELHSNGKLDSKEGSSEKTRKGKEIGAAVSTMCSLPGGATKTLEFSLVWDMPVVIFRSKEVQYARRYARWFGKSRDQAPQMSSYCLQNYSMWEDKIQAWQNPILNCSAIPAWYKSFLLNELYYVADDAEIGDGDSEVHSIVKEYGKFAYLEGHEYRMYNTYDVHFYASFALIMLWPKLQLSLQYDLGKAVISEDQERMKFCMGGSVGHRKVLNTVPHDMGDPEDEPWVRVNSYNIHPTVDWKDLNLKFVLQVYRDYFATNDRAYLEYMYPIMKVLMERSLQWDKDNDGLIENGGFADQTFDAWVVHGASAYCGGLWLCALRMFVESAKILNEQDDLEKYTSILNKAKESYEIKLWNGHYYNYDCSTCGNHDSIMADQLAGNWYMKASGITDNTVFPEDRVKIALKTVFESNVMGFADGNMGAINGTRPDGKKDITSCQSEEFWTGVTSGLAAQMIQEGMLEEAFKTAWGNYNVCWEWLGFMFQSPEAYMTSKHFRSLGYMRALAVWSIQWALEKYHPDLFKS
ncbi:non-lysosomal glucosylceramidase-like [Mercenaria mercenaria]|uniref:non-lysosomal glucosylceramidase-like n=1 Tax=Mercenaria mercenaria TaxID=6596 RepID=UPI00234E3941|nr:non-lysosomal glucosylceramidase-like [Mercenaria mercenaria]